VTLAKTYGFSCFLSPVQKILREGNTAQQWLGLYHQGLTPQQILQQGIQKTADREYDLEDKLCDPIAA
ncbi:MAG: putative glutamate--cysteine ligase, partial [Spirulinaceae cyanobacterium]